MVRTLLVAVAASLLATGCSLIVDPEKYAPAECPAGQKACGYKCVSVDDPETGCGGESCDACPGGPANSAAACGSDGQCGFACNPGWGDCSNGPLDGCEMRVDSGLSCGSCGRTCPGNCDTATFVCVPAGPAATGGVTKGLAEDAATGWIFALVQSSLLSGQFARISDISVPLQPLESGLGEVSGLSLFGGAAWFGKRDSNSGMAELGHYAALNPLAATLPLDAISSPGPVLDVVSGSSGTLWIPGADGRARFVASGMSAGAPVTVGTVATAVAQERGTNLYLLATRDDGGTIWATSTPGTAPTYAPRVVGAGNVGAMVAIDLGTEQLLYWVDVDRGDVWRHTSVGNRKERIFSGSRPTQMYVAVDSAGDVYWTDRAAGTVMAWKSYGGYPKTAHVIGRSPAPGRILVNAASVYWADDQDQAIRAVGR